MKAAQYYKMVNFFNLKDKNYLKELQQVENEYKIRLDKFKKLLPYYIRKNNLKDLRNEFEWIHSL